MSEQEYDLGKTFNYFYDHSWDTVAHLLGILLCLVSSHCQYQRNLQASAYQSQYICAHKWILILRETKTAFDCTKSADSNQVAFVYLHFLETNVLCVCVCFFYLLTKQFSTQKWEIGPNSKTTPYNMYCFPRNYQSKFSFRPSVPLVQQTS